MTLSTYSEHFIERHRGGEKAVLVHIDFPPRLQTGELEEFKELAHADALQTLEVITGTRKIPDAKFFIGKGKVEEIVSVVNVLEAEVVIFNHELTPAQGRNLEQAIGCRVLDRTELILDIFAKRARTFEGKLQVELAQLQHLSTQLVHGWTHLERQKGGIGLRGPGETQLETDRRLLATRIKTIKKKLEKVHLHREQSRRSRKRQAMPTVSLVGYTNAGKSTLFNQITQSDVYTANLLFATLDPTLRQLHLDKLGKVVLADTVGFIRHLPHDLVAAFRATLEETRQADLLLHIVDISQADYQHRIDDVQAVLLEIGASDVPQLLVYNKIDQKSGLTPRLDRDSDGMPNRVWLSARSGEGFEFLLQGMQELLSGRLIERQVKLSPHQGKLRATLYELGAVLHEYTDESGEIILDLEIRFQDYARLFNTNKEQ